VLPLSFINPACARFSCPAIGPEFRQATDSSFAVLFADAARQAMGGG
jgi:hypothetical protein